MIIWQLSLNWATFVVISDHRATTYVLLLETTATYISSVDLFHISLTSRELYHHPRLKIHLRLRVYTLCTGTGPGARQAYFTASVLVVYVAPEHNFGGEMDAVTRINAILQGLRKRLMFAAFGASEHTKLRP